jgi:hypothetical protein
VKKPILWVLLASVLGIASQATAKVSTRVCLADGNTPLEPINSTLTLIEYPDIMVGTKLTIIVSSDVNEYWSDGGSLAIEEAYLDYGILSARGPKVSEDWSGSHLPAAGNEALVVWWPVNEFDLYTTVSGDIQAGDWFIIDYNAINIGTCNVGFYDYSISWDNPVYYIKFSHVRTRDFNKDTKVDFSDFAVFASHWQETGCNDPNWCEGTDLGTDSNVDFDDLMLFADYWLEKTE